MSDSLRGHAEDIDDSILNATASELVAVLSQPSDEILEVDNKDSKDEPAKVMVTDESYSSIDDQRTDASIENNPVDEVDRDNEIGKSTDKLDPAPDSQKNILENEIDNKNQSKKDIATSDEKNAVEMEELIKAAMLEDSSSETSESSGDENYALPFETDLCSKFATLLGTPKATSSKEKSKLPNRKSVGKKSELYNMISKYFGNSQASLTRYAENSVGANNTESNLRIEQSGDSSGKNEYTPEKTSDEQRDLRQKNAGELESVDKPLPRTPTSSPAKEICRDFICRRKEVHDSQQSCKLSSIIVDLRIRKASEEIKNDPEKSSSEGSLEGAFENTKHETEAPDQVSKNPLKRSLDSQPDAPSAKHRRRCMSTKNVETAEARQHFRFISADAKKCSADKGTGHAGSSPGTSGVCPSRKRKVERSKMLLKEFSFNTKRFKQNETSSSEKESSDSKEESE